MLPTPALSPGAVRKQETYVDEVYSSSAFFLDLFLFVSSEIESLWI